MAHVAFDHSDSLRPCDKSISWLNRTPHAIAVYASWPALPSAHATLATRRPATALPGSVLHRLDRASFAWRLPEHALIRRTALYGPVRTAMYRRGGTARFPPYPDSR